MAFATSTINSPKLCTISTETMYEEAQDANPYIGPAKQVFFAILLAVFAYYSYGQLVQYEAGESVSMNRMLWSVYDLLGKWA